MFILDGICRKVFMKLPFSRCFKNLYPEWSAIALVRQPIPEHIYSKKMVNALYP